MGPVDVAVVGAGPAGAAAAIELARAGLEVVLLDRSTFPRDKCCGDGLTTGALRHLEHLGLQPATVASWRRVDACMVRSPSGRVVELPFPRGRRGAQYAAVARRTDLDAALVDVARATGAKVSEGRAVAGATWSSSSVTLETGAGPVTARYVVAADGAWSPVRKALGLAEPGYLGEWHAARQYVPFDGPGDMWVWFERDLLPGYAWSFPLADGWANVGFGALRRPGVPVPATAARWDALLCTPHVAAVIGDHRDGGDAGGAAGPPRAWPIPARLSRTTVSGAGGRVLFAGDAARAADPMTGEGIAQALETGIGAARAIVRAGPLRAPDAGAAYQRWLASGMAVDHRLAAGLSGVLATELGARMAVRAAGTWPWGRRQFARWLFEDYPRALVATPWRWRPGALRGEAPYPDDV